MFKEIDRSNEYKFIKNTKKSEQCSCDDKNLSYKLIENYRSILDRKQQVISTWKIFNQNNRIHFTRGTKYRQHTDVLVLRLNHIYLINPWYKYINVDKYLSSIVQQNQYDQVYEIVLLECNCLNDLHEFELAIIECPCLEESKTYCTYCRLIITAIEQSNTFNNKLDHSFSRLESCQDQCTVHNQNELETESDTRVDEDIFEEFIDQETQTKLFATLLPQCLLSEMNEGQIEEKTSVNITQSCQVNTLSYLIKTNENQRDIQSSTLAVQIKTRLIKVLSSDEYTEHETNLSTTKSEEEEDELLDDIEEENMHSTFMNRDQTNDFFLTLSPLKCINACHAFDLDEPNISLISSTVDDNTISPRILSDTHTMTLEHINVQHKTYEQSYKNNSNNHILQNLNNELSSSNCQITKLYRLITRKRRRNRNKKRIYCFLRRLYLHKKSSITPLFSSKNQSDFHLPSTSIPISKDISPINQRQQSIIQLNLHNINTTPQYKAYNHAIIIRTSKYSTTSKQLQTLINNPNTLLEELIDLQLQLTLNNNSKSVCILIDDHKHSEQYRSSFLHYIYTTLSNTLNKILHQNSIQITCMNLAFFNNSICDLINMQRLRLVDTGKNIYLLPSCEIPLKTSDDIYKAINRLSTKMSYAHQILIINFSHDQYVSLSGSFFFLQLAPICSIQSTGLFNNLNSTTYSVLNLIRQLNFGQLINQNKFKRYLLNDCLLNRLLKTYLFSSQQTMNVITIKQENLKK